MNDDNLRFVKFAQRLYRKATANGVDTKEVPFPQLCHGPLPRICGFNYRKMAKANENCIFLSDSDDSLEEKISRLMHFKYLFRHDPSYGRAYASDPKKFHLPDEYLPFSYLRAFGYQTKNWQVDERLRCMDALTELKAMLTEVLINRLIRPIRERSVYYRTREDELWTRLELGTEEATKVAGRLKDLIQRGAIL